ncbi:MAG: hypothetical protein LBC86_10450 [Oscillospiraceae bacterium]|nr:hypothetical protein [Oscillospiraceae bacterium]
MKIIELKRKPAEIIIRAVCGFLALFTLFMLTVSLVFSLGGDAPSLFGRNIYIVRTDTVEFLKPGTALFTQSVSFNEIHPGDIVVFNSLDGSKAGLAEVETVQESDNVYRFEAIGESGAEITLAGSQIVGRATQYSDFFGAVIGFAKSAAGVMIIAVIPCMIILIFEASKAIFGVFRKDGEIRPVKKQSEIPTYVPRQKISGRNTVKEELKEESEEDDYGRMLAEIAEKDATFADSPYSDNEDDFPLFRQPVSKTVNINKPASAPRIAPLSQKRLNQAIAEVNARKVENTGRITDRFPFNKTDEIMTITPTGTDTSATYEVGTLKEIKAMPAPVTENVKKYTPKKNTPAQRVAQTTSIPSLDRLLREEDPEVENAPYNIEDILFSIDKKR